MPVPNEAFEGRSWLPSTFTLALISALVLIPALLGHTAAGAGMDPASRAPNGSTWDVSAPSSDLTVTASIDSGRLSLSATQGSATVIESSPLGVETSAGDYVAGLEFVRQQNRRVQTSYSTPTGKRHRHRDAARETTLWFKNRGGNSIALDVRVFDDGFGYRYRIPRADDHSFTVTEEESSFRLPDGSQAWVLPYTAWYEKLWRQEAVGDFTGEYGLAPTFEVRNDSWVQLGESSTYNGRYAGAHLSVSSNDPTRFQYTLPDEAVRATGSLITPWRTAVIGAIEDVVESDLAMDLSPESRIDNTSWIRPGRAAWSWWSGGDSGDFQLQKDYVDYAAQRGWEYVLVDAGWDASSIPELVEYANQRNVDIMLWARYAPSSPDDERPHLETQEEWDRHLPQWKSWGVSGVKIDFMESDSQARMQWYDGVLAATAKHELMVNFHGSTLPRGIQRTWPHVMTLESVRGAEWYKCRDGGWDEDPEITTCDLTPEHNTILPFTRNVGGSMDYTPVTFSAEDRTTSDGHELAMSVVYESGLQHFSDSPESYQEQPLAEQFLEQVPASWDQSQLIDGQPGRQATFARRSGQQWFVGSIVAGAPRTIEVPLDFLGGGRYLAEIYRDDSDGLAMERTQVTQDSTLRVPVTENGGLAVQICRSKGPHGCHPPSR